MVLAIRILKKADITSKHFKTTVMLLTLVGLASIYINSALAHPTYVDGKLISVDHMPNFFFTVKAPIDIALTEKWQWILYFFVISVLAIGSTALCYIPVFRKKK